MQNKIVTQTELLQYDFTQENNFVLDGLLKTGVYLLVGTSKIGKSLLATDLANAVATGGQFLNKGTTAGNVIYFENDNYINETNSRVKALGYNYNDNLVFNFKDSFSFNSVTQYLRNFVFTNHNIKLIVIDSLANLSDITDTDNYKKNYETIKNFSKFIVEHKLCCVIIHHSRKGNTDGQDSTLGSRSLTGSVTGTILIDVENEFSDYGTLRFITRSHKTLIPIKKNPNGISWIHNDEEEKSTYNESIDYNALLIIKSLVNAKGHELEGSCQELCNTMNLNINPKGLLKFLNKNQKTLSENYVYYTTSRNNLGRFINLKYNENDSCDSLFSTKTNCQTVTKYRNGE